MDLKLNKIPWQVQLGVFVSLAIGAAVAFYLYYEQPFQAEMATREAKLAALRVDINKGLATARKLQQFRSEVALLENRLNGLKQVLPDEKDAADLLRRMQTVASQSNLTIKSFKPSPVVTKQMHVEWPIALELDGTYDNLAMFFDRVSKFTRIVNISAVDVKGKERPLPNSSISASCIATTFVLIDKPAKGAAKAPAPAAPKGT